MTPVEKQKLLDDVLAWVNRIRSEHALTRLPALRRGVRRSLCRCPVAESLLGFVVDRAEVSRDFYLWDGEELIDSGETPVRVREFMAAFDGGYIPELDAVAA